MTPQKRPLGRIASSQISSWTEEVLTQPGGPRPVQARPPTHDLITITDHIGRSFERTAIAWRSSDSILASW